MSLVSDFICDFYGQTSIGAEFGGFRTPQVLQTFVFKNLKQVLSPSGFAINCEQTQIDGSLKKTTEKVVIKAAHAHF